MIHDLSRWLADHLTIPGLPTWLSVVVLSVSMAVVSLVFTVIALIRIPADYFAGKRRPAPPDRRHFVLRVLERIARNIMGWFLIGLGIVLSFPGVPGQGVLTILLGVMLVDFPGKRRVEQRFIAWPRVRGAVDALRKRFGREPLQLDESES